MGSSTGVTVSPSKYDSLKLCCLNARSVSKAVAQH